MPFMIPLFMGALNKGGDLGFLLSEPAYESPMEPDVTVPSSVEAGDLLVLSSGLYYPPSGMIGSADFSTPSGFTTTSRYARVSQVGAGIFTGGFFAMSWKKATASDRGRTLTHYTQSSADKLVVLRHSEGLPLTATAPPGDGSFSPDSFGPVVGMFGEFLDIATIDGDGGYRGYINGDTGWFLGPFGGDVSLSRTPPDSDFWNDNPGPYLVVYPE